MTKIARITLSVNSLILCATAMYFFLVPFGLLVRDVHDSSLYDGQVPQLTYRLHRALSDNIAEWAQQRTRTGKAATVDVLDISGTEWPMFSSVFYLWATEALQAQFIKSGGDPGDAPAVYGSRAIDAAAALIVDPNNAAWVKRHWGETYLSEENIFYRMLLISGLTSFQALKGDNRYEPLLAQQVETLSAELARSPFGLLDDYPNQCYPVDVLPAIAAIQRASSLLGVDRADFVRSSVRGFEQSRLDPETQLPAYIASSKTGAGFGPARGVGVAYMLIWAPELWPATASEWYERYEHHFWQEGKWVASVREFSKHSSYSDWQMDVDAGPVFAGIGTAASAFGLGAARANGRFDQAYPLSAEALVASWPLPDGTLLVPRLLSNLSDAPYVGEAALLFSLTRSPASVPHRAGSKSLPLVVYLGLSVYALIGSVLVYTSVRNINVLRQPHVARKIAFERMQLLLWAVLIVAASVLAFAGYVPLAVLTVVIAGLFPRLKEVA